MTLKPCPECGRYIARDARACPYCGKSIMHAWEVLLGLMIVLLVVAVAGVVIYTAHDPSRVQQVVNSFDLLIK